MKKVRSVCYQACEIDSHKRTDVDYNDAKDLCDKVKLERIPVSLSTEAEMLI